MDKLTMDERAELERLKDFQAKSPDDMTAREAKRLLELETKAQPDPEPTRSLNDEIAEIAKGMPAIAALLSRLAAYDAKWNATSIT